jgi:hypothetical protein
MNDEEEIKKAGELVEYTHETIVELERCRQDPIYCIRKYFKVEHPTRGLIPFELRDYQIEMIEMFKNNRYSIMMCARQLGKSVTAGAYLLWFSMFNDQKTILIASDKNSNALEIIYRMQTMYRSAPAWLKPGVTKDGWNKQSLKFDNNTRILSAATTEKTGRGMSLSVIFCDELAFVGYGRKENVAEEFWTSISATLSTGGDCIISSTPLVDDDTFATIWRGAVLGNNGFAHLKKTWRADPNRTEEWKQQEIGRIGLTKFLREYECEMVGDANNLISGIRLTQLVHQPHIRELKDFKIWTEFDKEKTYIVGVDPSTGTGSDYSVIEVFTFPELEQIAEFRSNVTSSAELYRILKSILLYMEPRCGEIYYSMENNGIGEGILTAHELDESPPEKAELISEGKRIGMTTGDKSKLKAAISLKDKIESDDITLKSQVLITEIKGYTRSGRRGYEAKAGYTDDAISALLIVLRLYEHIIMYDDDAYQKVMDKMNKDYFDDIEGMDEVDSGGVDDAPPILF